MSKINELKIKYKMLQEMPKSREFLGTIMDFNILTSLDESRSDAYMNQRFSENDYNHCINSINSFISPEPKANKENFALNLIIQMNELLSGEIQEQKKELIQALYITIFSKYNIDKDHVIMHHHRTGKICPNPWCVNESALNGYKNFIARLDDSNSKESKEKLTIAKPTLKKGSKSTQVAHLQRCLNKIMKSDIKVDGIFGNDTATLLRKFQGKYNLIVDGVYGEKSRKMMDKLL